MTAALSQRFSPENQAEKFRVQLKNRLHGRNETLLELAQAIRRLTRRAYPSANYQLQETLPKEYFVDALNDGDIRWRVFQSRPVSLEDALRVAVELEAFQVAEKQRVWPRRPTTMVISADEEPRAADYKSGRRDVPEEQMASFTMAIGKMMEEGFKNLRRELHAGSERHTNLSNSGVRTREERRGPRHPTVCWRCNEAGHMMRECPRARQSGQQTFRQGNGQQSNNRADVRRSNPGPAMVRRREGPAH